MTELAKHIAQQVAEYCGRGTPERLEEIIDSAGVRELTARLEECKRVSLENLKQDVASQEELETRVRELTAELEAEIENRKGWQNRAADAEAKIYHSETPCEGESPDPPINLRERVRELTEQEAALRKSLEEERAKVAQRNSVIVGKGEDNMRLHLHVWELTEALEQTLVIARQALVYFNTESGRVAMKELDKIEARIKGEK